MRRRVAGLLLATSVVAGMGAGVVADSVTSDDPAVAEWPTIALPAPVTTGVEAKDPVLVMNDDGGATLSATLINHTKRALDMNSATGGQEDDVEAPAMLVYIDRDSTWLEPAQTTRIGAESAGYRIQFRTRVQVGSTLPVTLVFTAHEPPSMDPVVVTFRAPVVERNASHAEVANSDRSSAITVNEPTIVVVPGQTRAYVGGYITSAIKDTAFELPTAVNAVGETIQYRHQSATGGPFGIFAVPGEKSYFRPLPYLDDGPPRYLDDGTPGTADYFRATDVTVGEKITITFRFPSGDVVAKFAVVQGKADGTI